MTEINAPTEPSVEALDGYEDIKPGGWEDSAIREANAALLPTTLERIYQTGAIA